MAKNETKAWYDGIDVATLQRIKTYSAFNDATSKNLMMQTMYEYREKEIQDFKETNHELAETCIARKKRIADLEKENKELKTDKIPQLERRIASIRGAHSVDCKKLNARTEQCERQKKRITELEKENAELNRKLSKIQKRFEPQNFTDLMNEVEKEYTDEQKINELEKENSRLNQIILGNEEEITDLRKGCEEYSKIFNRQNDEIISLRKKMIKAKEIINEFMRISKANDEDFEHDYTELIAEAEQFLSEVEHE